MRSAWRAVLRFFASLLRVTGGLALAVLLLTAGAGYYLYQHFNPETVRGLAVDQLSRLLGREVSIERLVLSPRGVRVVGLRVRGARQGSAEDLLFCDSALVTIRPAPLLQRRLEFGTVRLQSPRISISRAANGAWSFADIFTSSASSASLPLALAAAETSVEDGVLRVEDRLRGRRLVLGRLRLSVRGFNLDKPFPVKMSFVSDARLEGSSFETRVAAEGRVDLAGLRLSESSAVASSLRIEAGGVVILGHAGVKDFANPRVEAALDTPALGPRVWLGVMGQPWPLSLPPVRWTLRAALPAPGMVDVEKLSAVTSAGRATASGVFDVTAATSTLGVELALRDVDLDELAAWYEPWAHRGFSGRLSGRLALTGWPGRLEAREGVLSVKQLSGRWGAVTLQGVDAEASAFDEFNRFEVSLSSGRGEAFGEPFSDAALHLSITGQDLSVDRLSLRWNNSPVHLRARVAHLSAPKAVLLSGSVDALDVDRTRRLVESVRAAISTRTAAAEGGAPRPWVRLFKYSIPHGFPDTTAHLRVGAVSHATFWCRDVDLLWTLKNVTPALDKVSGEGRLSFGPGRVNDIPAVQSVSPFLRVIFLPFIYMHKMNNLSVLSAGTAYPKTLDFTRIEGEYGITRGVAVTRYFHVESPQLAAYAEGWADFVREQVDMNILTRLSSFRGVLPEWWVDEAGRPAIGFRVKGDLNHPELAPRFKKIGASEIEAKVEEGRSQAHKRYEALERLNIL